MVSDNSSARPTFFSRTWKTLGSVQLAVVLIVLLAIVLAWATILESAYGREYAQWFVYGGHWFVVLLAMLGLNIFAATIMRFPWKKRLAFLLTHTGILVLLFGSIQTFMSGMEGQLSIVEGETAGSLMIPTQTRFTASWPERSESRMAAFILRPGPVDWTDDKSLDLGELNGVRLRILKFLRHARVEQTWVQDDSASGTPVLQFALDGPDGSRLQEHWLVAEQFGGTVSMGPATFEFQKLAAHTMVEDFLNPPTEDLGEMGVLSVHHAGKIKRISVKDHLGEKVPLDDGEISIEIKEYLPNAIPAGNAQFTSEGEVAANPMLEILVHGSETTKPIRQIAFAKHPLLNFDGIHGWTSPVKFWFHHLASAPKASTEFVQAPDRKLYCRTALDGKFTSHGQIGLEQSIPTAAGFHVSVLQHLSSANEQVTFHPVSSNSRSGKNAEAAALLEVQAGGATEELWLKRQDSTYGFRTISTPEGALTVGLDYEQLPLRFSVELLNFSRSKNPGGMGNASFKSQVRLVDRYEGIDEEAEISMNTPLTHGKYTLYQSSFQELPSGKEASIFTVAYDPGRFLKYVGCLMICFGSFAMFYARTIGSLTSRLRSRRHAAVPSDGKSSVNEPASALAADETQTSAHSGQSRQSQVA